MVFIYPSTQPALKCAIAILQDGFGAYADVSTALPRNYNLVKPFVQVQRVGGQRPNIVTDDARILVSCFASTPEVVEHMTSTVGWAFSNAIGTIVENCFVRDWSDVSGPVDLVHPDFLTLERWQVTGTLALSTTPGS
jgi:hypothetical protein